MDPTVARLHENIKEELRLEMEAEADRKRKREANPKAAAAAAASARAYQRKKNPKAAAAWAADRQRKREEKAKAAAVAADRQRKREAKKAKAAAWVADLQRKREDIKAKAAAADLQRKREEKAKAAAVAADRQRKREAKKAKAAAVADRKRKREDIKAKAAAADLQRKREAKAKKVSDRAEKITTALAKEAESAKYNSWGINVMNAIKKCTLFYHHYNNDDEDYSPVKEMLRYSVEKDYFAIKCYDADNKLLFPGAALALIPCNAIWRQDRSLEEKNLGVECRRRTRRLDVVIEMLLRMGGAISKSGQLRIPNLKRVFEYEDNHHKLDRLMEILKSNCARAHQKGQDLHCSVNAAVQIQLLIEHPDAVAAAAATGDPVLDVVAADIQFQQADELFKFPDGSQLSMSGSEFPIYVEAHADKWARILKSIEDHLVKDTPLPQYITDLNLNIANASMQYVHYRKKDGSYEKSEKKVLVFGITWCIAAFCTGASGLSYCRNGDLVLRKFHEEVLVDGRGRVFNSGRFDSKVELREVPQQKSNDGYHSVPVSFSSQFIPYIYQSAMRVATLQWAGILGSFYILAETCDHLTGDKEKNSILHTQPASKQENIDRRPLQGLAPLVGGRKCLH